MSDKTQVYEGKGITVYFEGKRCIHSGKCVHGLPGVFRANVKGPWIDPDAADADTLAALINTCPSGALRYKRTDGGAAEAAPQINTISMEADGPLHVHADYSINGAKGASFRASLCRCGASANKPFCDNAHKVAGFSDPGLANPGKLEETKVTGQLNIDAMPDGPLLVEGCCEVRGSDDTPISRGNKTALCRCGASKNKPFCDGSHVMIGFKA